MGNSHFSYSRVLAAGILGLCASTSPALSQDAVTIDKEGNVGVGTAAPRAQLDIQQAVRTGTHSTAVKGLYVTGDIGESDKGIEFRHSNGTQGIGFGYNTIYATGTNADQPLALKPKGTSSVVVKGDLDVAGAATIAGITTLSGKAGVGTKAPPVAQLDVQQGDSTRIGTHPTSVKGLYVTGDFGVADGVEFRHSNATQGIGIGYNTIYATGTDTSQALNLKPRGTSPVAVQGNLTVTGTTNGQQPPMKFSLQQTGRWIGVAKDVSAHCLDDDGCRIDVLMLHKNGEPRVIGEHLYIQGRRGWTRQEGGGDAGYSWDAKHEIFSPWGWSWAHTYRHQNYNGEATSLPVGYIGFMTHPDVRTTFIVYDH